MSRKRRRKPSAATRVRPFWLPIGFVLLLLGGAVTFVAIYPGFDPKRVSVSGNNRVDRQEILTRAAIAPNLTIWLQNTGAIARRVAEIPYIDRVRVRRIPPAAIRIAVTERVPFAVVRSGYDAAIVDRTLRVLEPATAPSALPDFDVELSIDLTPGTFVHSSDALALRAAYETMAGRHMTPVQLSLDRYGGLVVTMRSGVRLMLGGQDDLPEKLGLADAILSQIVTGRRRVAAVDLRAPAAPVLVYR